MVADTQGNLVMEVFGEMSALNVIAIMPYTVLGWLCQRSQHLFLNPKYSNVAVLLLMEWLPSQSPKKEMKIIIARAWYSKRKCSEE